MRKKYKFKIEFTDGTEMYVKGEGISPTDALHTIINSEQYQELTKDLELDSITPEEEDDILPIPFDACVLQKSKDEGW